MFTVTDARPVPGSEDYAIILVNWNGGGLTRRALSGVGSVQPAPWCVYVVDNGSQDGSADDLESLTPGLSVVVIKNSDNRGFAAAVNQGMAAAIEAGVPFLFLLNNDAELRTDTLARLFDAARRHPEADLLAPKIVRPDGRLWCAGVDLGWFPNLQRLRGFDRPDHGQYDREEPVDALTGCGLLIRSALIARVGAFDEAYFVYLEDIDLCLRARAAERACRYVPSAVMVHDASASSGGGYGAWRKHMVAYNLVLLLRRRGTPKLWMAFWVLEVLAWPLLFVSAAFRGRTRAALAKARGTWKALLHRPHERPVIPGAAS